MFFFFFFNDTATTEIYTLSLHDALPIFRLRCGWRIDRRHTDRHDGGAALYAAHASGGHRARPGLRHPSVGGGAVNSEHVRTGDQLHRKMTITRIGAG